jgi:hypothetical protein
MYTQNISGLLANTFWGFEKTTLRQAQGERKNQSIKEKSVRPEPVEGLW